MSGAVEQDAYREFLISKMARTEESGIEIQDEDINSMLFPFQRDILKWSLKNGRSAIFAECGLGKGQPYGSNVLTPRGWVKIENLTVGDMVISSDGSPSPVTGVYPKSEQETYRFWYSDGSSIVVDTDHLHICRTNNDRYRGNPWRVMSTKDLLNCGNLRYGSNGKSRNYDIPVVGDVQFENTNHHISPYVIGVLLGDGCLKWGVSISSADVELISRFDSELPDGTCLKQKSKYDWNIKTGYSGNRRHPFRQSLHDMGLLGKLSHEKFVPHEYLFSGPKERLDLLRGLMDTDGYISECGCCQFYSVSEQLVDDVIHLVRSIGGVPTKSVKKTSLNGQRYKNCHIATFSLATHNPFFLTRKAERWNQNPRDNGRWIDRIEKESIQKTICISVDSKDQSYVTENFIVTHNTPVQLEWARHVVEHTGMPVLILAPLAVSQQTKREGEKFGIECSVVRDGDEVVNGINITNYERIEKFDPSVFGGVVLDESSILKSFTGKTKQLLCDSFDQTPFRLCCTATPAPNDHVELGNHSDFLGIMTRSEMLARWFVHDSGQTAVWRIKHHAVKPFWTWVSSWAVCIRKPSDLGYSDEGFILPKLHQHRHVIPADYEALGDEIGEMFYSPTTSATSIHKVMRVTAESRAQEVGRIVNESTGPFVVWCHTNYEADALCKAIPEAVEVRGNDKPEAKESKLLGFVSGEFRVLITKPKIAGFGMNWQHCCQGAFVGMSYSYEAFYQAVRRKWRFGQKNEVHIHTVMSEAEQQIYDNVMVKASKHDEMGRSMYENFQFGITGERGLVLDYEQQTVTGDGWELMKGDCIEETKKIEDNVVDFTIFSPPFSQLYVYSDSARDMGNSPSDEKFFEHFSMLVPELLRVTRPGRLVAVHCINIPLFKYKTGFTGLYDFRGDIIRAFLKSGFVFHSEIVIRKDPVTEMQRTKSIGLLHKQLCKDSTMSRQANPDHVVVFKKKTLDEIDYELVEPVCGESSACRFDYYVGDSGPNDRDIEPKKHSVGFDTSMVTDDDVSSRLGRKRKYSIEVWQRYAESIWDDIRQGNVLNRALARDEKDEKHVCPLQLDVIERAVHLWTNPGDLVFSPFAGIGSEGYGALKQGRRFVGVELKDSYFDRACLNLKDACSSGDQLSIFDEVEKEDRTGDESKKWDGSWDASDEERESMRQSTRELRAVFGSNPTDTGDETNG